jgi:hypothetical protein
MSNGDRSIPAGSIFFPFHFVEAAANLSTNGRIDPRAKIPDSKVCTEKSRPIDASTGLDTGSQLPLD